VRGFDSGPPALDSDSDVELSSVAWKPVRIAHHPYERVLATEPRRFMSPPTREFGAIRLFAIASADTFASSSPLRGRAANDGVASSITRSPAQAPESRPTPFAHRFRNRPPGMSCGAPASSGLRNGARHPSTSGAAPAGGARTAEGPGVAGARDRLRNARARYRLRRRALLRRMDTGAHSRPNLAESCHQRRADSLRPGSVRSPLPCVPVNLVALDLGCVPSSRRRPRLPIAPISADPRANMSTDAARASAPEPPVARSAAAQSAHRRTPPCPQTPSGTRPGNDEAQRLRPEFRTDIVRCRDSERRYLAAPPRRRHQHRQVLGQPKSKPRGLRLEAGTNTVRCWAS
jgi:hypothetical protein